MTMAQAMAVNSKDFAFPGFELEQVNRELESMSAEQRVAWALERFQGRIVLSSSFGAQAAVSLHMVIRQCADIPVVLIDTGYLFPETYQFIDALTERLALNLKVYRAELSPAWLEARHGKLWEQGLEGIELYNRITKIEPMQRALEELQAQSWIAGLRRQQSSTRQNLEVLALRNQRVKVHPLIDWTDRDVFRYLKQYDLPYHPLWEQGYVSIGDIHTTQPLTAGMTEEQTRFFGLKRECGLHEDFSI
jgi:phosphoadenosine phosphosulfate reductase